MSKPTLLAELYQFLLDSGAVHFSQLEARFPNEFRSTPSEHGFTRATGSSLENSALGRRWMSEAMKDAICFLIAEDFVELLPSGTIVRRHATMERSQDSTPWYPYPGIVASTSPPSAHASRN